MLLVLAERRTPAGLGERRADPDRRLRLRHRRDRAEQKRQERGQSGETREQDGHRRL